MFNFKVLIFATLALITFDVYAQDSSNHPLINDDWLIRIGGQQADADVKAGLANPQFGEIPLIDIGDGDADTTVTSFWTDITWQAPERWSFSFSYFRAKADGQKISQSDISFGNLDIPVGTGIAADFETDFYVLNGYYDFFRTSHSAAGIGLGVYALDLSVSAQTLLGGAPTGTSEAASTLAPLPTLSAYYKHAFSDKLALMVNSGWLSADIDEYDGSIFAADLRIEYWPRKSWGLGAGYTYVDLELTVDKPVFDQRYEVEYNSFFGFVTWGF